jgi:hypothetical protein
MHPTMLESHQPRVFHTDAHHQTLQVHRGVATLMATPTAA